MKRVRRLFPVPDPDAKYSIVQIPSLRPRLGPQKPDCSVANTTKSSKAACSVQRRKVIYRTMNCFSLLQNRYT
jgi:hypothetical protein